MTFITDRPSIRVMICINCHKPTYIPAAVCNHPVITFTIMLDIMSDKIVARTVMINHVHISYTQFGYSSISFKITHSLIMSFRRFTLKNFCMSVIMFVLSALWWQCKYPELIFADLSTIVSATP